MKTELNRYKSKIVKKIFGFDYKTREIMAKKEKLKPLPTENYISPEELAIERWETDGGSIGGEVWDKLRK